MKRRRPRGHKVMQNPSTYRKKSNSLERTLTDLLLFSGILRRRRKCRGANKPKAREKTYVSLKSQTKIQDRKGGKTEEKPSKTQYAKKWKEARQIPTSNYKNPLKQWKGARTRSNRKCRRSQENVTWCRKGQIPSSSQTTFSIGGKIVDPS